MRCFSSWEVLFPHSAQLMRITVACSSNNLFNKAGAAPKSVNSFFCLVPHLTDNENVLNEPRTVGSVLVYFRVVN